MNHQKPSDINGTWSRRDVLRFSLLAAGMATSGLMLHGTAAHAQPPRRGGRIRVALSNSSVADTLDPAKGSNSTDYVRHHLFYSGLTELDEEMRPVSALATSFESDDGKVWHFKLRAGVTFHDGKSLSSNDVVWSLLRHKEPNVASKAKSLADQFETVEALSPDMVRITLLEPNVDLPAILATSHFLIVAADTSDFSLANGTGPFRCEAFTPGGVTLGKRNENYWKDGLPYVDEITLIGLTDQTARVNGLLAGNLDVIARIDPRDIDRIRASGHHDVLETKSGQYTNLILRQDNALTGNPDFVLAMKYLQNRERMLDVILQGYGSMANDHPVPDWHPYYIRDLPQRPYDPEKARYHIQRGKLEGMGGELVCASNISGAIDGAQMMQQNGRAVGLDLKVRRVPYDGYWSQHWMKHPMSYGSINTRPTLDMLLTFFYASDSPWNESGWKNEQFDQLLVLARGEINEQKRRQMYGDMQVLIHEKCGILIPAFISYLDAYHKRVKGLIPNPSGMLMGYRFAESVWLDA